MANNERVASGFLVPQGYRPRLVEARLDTLLESFGCVEITGPKWCGKTWTALTRSRSVSRLDAPGERAAAQTDPGLALLGERPHLVDEWQEVPQVWDAARRAVDEAAGERGLFMLTGSCGLSPQQRGLISHSGAGRIARLGMRPMALVETGDSTGQVSLAGLLAGEGLDPCRRDTSVEDVARWCCRGGWPSNLGLSEDVALETAPQYLRAVLDERVFSEGRSVEQAESLLRALSLNVSQAATVNTLVKDSGLGSDGLARTTVEHYVSLFKRLYLLDDVAGWEPPLRAKTRVRVKPKRYFTDPSLPAALLGATPQALLRDMQTLGLLFENLVARDLLVFLSTYCGLGNRLSYYRDEKGLEVDFIVEGAGAWGAVEVKLSDLKADDGARNLLRLRKKVLANGAAQNLEPAFMAVVVGRGSVAYRRNDGVYVIPVATLGA